MREQREMDAVLAKLGISRRKAARFRALADIPKAELEELIAQAHWPGTNKIDEAATILALRRRNQRNSVSA